MFALEAAARSDFAAPHSYVATPVGGRETLIYYYDIALSSRFSEALAFSADRHRDQIRKGTEIPYVSHLLAVASIVLEHGGSEDEAIAALLHDAVEDRKATAGEISARFGEGVAGIVLGCSDTDQHPKPPWRARKEQYIDHLATASPSTLLVSAADKLHNARAILADYREIGDRLWQRFNPDADTLWYYRALVVAFRASAAPAALVDELDRVVSELDDLVSRTASEETARRPGETSRQRLLRMFPGIQIDDTPESVILTGVGPPKPPESPPSGGSERITTPRSIADDENGEDY